MLTTDDLGNGLTRAEFYAKYGDVRVRFADYWKYTFTFKGEASNGDAVSVSYGGNADQIYRFGCASDMETTVAELQPYAGYVKRGDEDVEAFYDY